MLSTAAARDSGSIYPVSDTLAASRVAKALHGLTDRGLVEERETTDAASVRRADGDLRYDMFITEAGLAAIDAGPDELSVKASAPSAPKAAGVTKSTAVVTLLQRADGATMPELIEATGWLPHTTRAALTGLRKKGHAIERGRRDDATCYRILAAA